VKRYGHVRDGHYCCIIGVGYGRSFALFGMVQGQVALGRIAQAVVALGVGVFVVVAMRGSAPRHPGSTVGQGDSTAPDALVPALAHRRYKA
jgi:hypothetical protein